MTDTSWQNRVTLLVNSCDAYADLWQPFFTLLKRYFVPLPAEILLNTETKDFTFDGLNLRCVHSTAPTYGERMTDALREVKTEYTLLLLDDFFLRRPVDIARLSGDGVPAAVFCVLPPVQSVFQAEPLRRR